MYTLSLHDALPISCLAADNVTIDVDVRKVVVSADRLDLPQCVLERAPVPQPYVVKRFSVVINVDRGSGWLGIKLARLDLIESETASRPFDVVADVGRLALEFIRLNDETLDVGRYQDHANNINCDGNGDRDQ